MIKLDDLLVRFEELLNELGEPGVTDDPAHFQKLMKSRATCSQSLTHIKNIRKIRKPSRTVFPCWRARRTKRCVKC